ncbi:protein of unknown function [Roseovarius lutimaris]|uniref:Integrase DNA-binding domain-containing protein n=1 Tax=Roseovarius lutimaris TaxID=1005928 RepID=A0A1I5FEU4_9RHOB|nr:integrase arm-type DNA-binding domain-containing protein [Roseovarius lutimaris]SFO22338.1 protein of unknown function [Roseovarius lutimaris]
MKTHLTETLIKNSHWTGKETRLVDETLPGFYVAINKQSKTYKVKADLWVGTPGQRKKVRSINQAFSGTQELSLREARTKASVYLAQIKSGSDPFRKVETYDYTVGKILEIFILSRIEKGRRPATIQGYEKMARYYLKSILHESASGYELHKAYEFHKKITKKHGATSADKAIKLLSSAYRHIRPRTPSGTIDHNPFEGFEYNNPKRTPGYTMTLMELPNWYGQVELIKNPIRKGFHLSLLFSGMRKLTASQLEHDWVDTEKCCINIPCEAMKNDEELTLPASDQLLEILQTASRNSRRMYPRSPWIFPTIGSDGNVKPIQVAREKILGNRTGHVLRRTYRTAAALPGIADRNGDLLIGHKIPGIRGRYIDEPQLFGDLLRDQRVIAAFIDTHMFGE